MPSQCICSIGDPAAATSKVGFYWRAQYCLDVIVDRRRSRLRSYLATIDIDIKPVMAGFPARPMRLACGRRAMTNTVRRNQARTHVDHYRYRAETA